MRVADCLLSRAAAQELLARASTALHDPRADYTPNLSTRNPDPPYVLATRGPPPSHPRSLASYAVATRSPLRA
eukprot:1335927-Rhodomonas_salina.1